MKIFVVSQHDGQTVELQVNSNNTIAQIKTQLAQKHFLPENMIEIVVFGELLFDTELTLEMVGVKEGDMISMQLKDMSAPLPKQEDWEAKVLIQRAQKNSNYLEKLTEEDLLLTEALLTENVDQIKQILRRKKENAKTFGNFLNQSRPQNGNNNQLPNSQFNQQNQYLQNGTLTNPTSFQIPKNPQGFGQPVQLSNQNTAQNNLNFNPYMSFDLNSQKKIEEGIRMQRLSQLQQNAYENFPELFVSTQMLYINGKVNNVSSKVFIDTGAQVTVVSKSFAEKASLMKDVDHRVSQVIKGVGSQNSLGKIWMLELFIQNRCFLLSAIVLEKFDNDILLGLDMMKRHRCVIDLAQNEIKFGLEQVTSKFLTDYEVSQFKEKQENELVEEVQKKTGLNTEDALKLLAQNDYDLQKVIETFKKK